MGGLLRPNPLGELTALTRPRSWIYGVGLGTREGDKGKERREGRQGREGDTGRREGRDGEGEAREEEEGGQGGKEKGKGRGGEISPPRPFLKVGAYVCECCVVQNVCRQICSAVIS